MIQSMLRFLFIAILSALIFHEQLVFAKEQDYSLTLKEQSEQIEQLKRRLENLEKTVETLSIKNGSLAAGINPETKTENSLDDNSVLTSDAPETEKDQYDSALALLKNDKFSEAEIKFAKFIEQNPKHVLNENALFWYAETFYRREDFNKAAINYLKSYKEYPKGAKAADSLLKLSLSLGSMNKLKEACSIIDKLETEFPNKSTNFAKRAQEAKTKFLCNKKQK